MLWGVPSAPDAEDAETSYVPAFAETSSTSAMPSAPVATTIAPLVPDTHVPRAPAYSTFPGSVKVISSPDTGLPYASTSLAVATCASCPSAMRVPEDTSKAESVDDIPATFQLRSSVSPICSSPSRAAKAYVPARVDCSSSAARPFSSVVTTVCVSSLAPLTPAGTTNVTSTPAPTGFPKASAISATAVYVLSDPVPTVSGPVGSMLQVEFSELGVPAVNLAVPGEPETSVSTPSIATVA